MRVIITGAASGIGRSVAESLAAESSEHKLLLTDRDADGLAVVANAIGSSATTCVALQFGHVTRTHPFV